MTYLLELYLRVIRLAFSLECQTNNLSFVFNLLVAIHFRLTLEGLLLSVD